MHNTHKSPFQTFANRLCCMLIVLPDGLPTSHICPCHRARVLPSVSTLPALPHGEGGLLLYFHFNQFTHNWVQTHVAAFAARMLLLLRDKMPCSLQSANNNAPLAMSTLANAMRRHLRESAAPSVHTSHRPKLDSGISEGSCKNGIDFLVRNRPTLPDSLQSVVKAPGAAPALAARCDQSVTCE